VVKKEFKDHVGEMENMRNAAREKHHNNSMRWTTFEDEDENENCHPNLFSQQDHSFPKKQQNFTAKNDQSAYTNPFSHDYSESNGNKLRTESFQNPFWIPRQQY
jgi:Skp family chaperone for outer membrane proteins